MGRFIVKLAVDEYVEWSTVVDAPITYAVPRTEAIREWGAARIVRADVWGSSSLERRYDLERLLRDNRAGEAEAHITLDEIRHRYRRWRWWHGLVGRS